MKKKIGIITIIALFIISIFSVSFFTILPRATYELKNNNTYILTDLRGMAKSYEVSEKYNDLDVTEIAERALFNNKRIQKVILPSSVNKIDRLAFSECNSLYEINLDKVDMIERNAFSYCNSLTKITFNGRYLGSSVFYGCSNLEEVELGSNLKELDSYTFSKTKIKKLVIPKSVTVIGPFSFSDMEYLEEIDIYLSSIKEGMKYLNDLGNVKIINLG